ncbi:MAG: ATPase [Gammaproteobacteria bacterium]|nr:MAG: ATPase [Gammaproteobacteria bacterium]
MVDIEHTGSRLVALGSHALMRGFSLIGFETRPDATIEDLTQLLDELIAEKSQAVLVIEKGLVSGQILQVEQVRSEGGRIIVIEVPPLNAPDQFTSPVANKVSAMLGAEAIGDL